MKEVTYEDWIKNPTSRLLWVWNDSFDDKKEAIVICVAKDNLQFPVMTLTKDYTYCSYKYCAEIEEPRTRRMTNRELSWWLTEKPYREIKDAGWIFSRYYYIEENQFQEVKDDIFIREDGGEWREPLVETDEYKDYLESEKAYNDGV